MAWETETRFVEALMNGVGLETCPTAYQIIMGMALACHISDRKLGRPLVQFTEYLLAYAAGQEAEIDRRAGAED